MLPDDVPLNVRQLIFLIRIPKSNARMPETVQPSPFRYIFLIMPVVQKIIMQQRTSD
jgi:hypothetical protein